MRAAYDALAQQRVPMAIAHDGEIYDVVFEFKPLNDDLILAYFEGEEDGDKSAAEIFFDKHIVAAEGVDYPAEEFEQLREIVPAADKELAVREALLGAIRQPLPKASKKLNWASVKPQQVYKLTCYFNGGEVETAITLSTPGQVHLKTFRALESRAFPVSFGDHKIDSVAQGMKLLYEALNPVVSGYAPAGVPLHHKLLVIGLHLRGYRELILGK